MKAFCPHGLSLSLIAWVVFSIGCSGAETAEAPEPSTPPQQSVASTSPPSGAASPATSTSREATSALDVAEGSGTIKGVLKSPYVRTAEGIVFVVDIQGSKFEPPSENPVMDQKNKIFTPHLIPVLLGSTVDFPNTDDVRHSVYSREGSATNFNLGQYEAGIVKQVKFDELGVTHLACNIHTEMSAYVIARPNPYFGLIDRKGSFEIRDVPAGRHELSFFHEKIESATLEVTVTPDQETVVEFTGLKRNR